nr:MAG TPA: Ubiquitin-like protein [Caudoviricetes sp.]
MQAKLTLLKRDKKFKMIIPSSVEEKIRLACASVPNLEWSGVLFYTYKGSFKKLNLTVTCKDILVMDIGSSTYTEWATNVEVISYMTEHDLLDCQLGIVHSHNTMASFFSGTDTNTLLQEGTDRNNIVSLIVNNEGTYSAAITRKINSTATVKEQCKYQFFGEGELSYSEEYETEEQYVEYFMFNIVRKEPNKLFGFINRFSEIMAKKGIQTSSTQPVKHYYSPTYNNYSLENSYSEDGDYGLFSNSYNDIESPYTQPHTLTPTVTTPTTTIKNEPFDKQVNTTVNTVDYTDSYSDKVEEDYDAFIETICLQLITGNIFATDKGVIKLDAYIKDTMFNTYKERFGTDVSDSSIFRSWIGDMLDFLLYNSNHPTIDNGYSDHDKVEIIVEGIKERLSKIPNKNIFLITIIKDLNYYI